VTGDCKLVSEEVRQLGRWGIAWSEGGDFIHRSYLLSATPIDWENGTTKFVLDRLVESIAKWFVQWKGRVRPEPMVEYAEQ
jgi:hypothetical protein